MAVLSWSQSVAGGATFAPLTGWQYEYAPFGGRIQILHNATAVGVQVSITSGSDQLQQRSPLSAGGTAGVMPSAFAVPLVSDDVAAGDRIRVEYENTTAGAITVVGTIEYTPG